MLIIAGTVMLAGCGKRNPGVAEGRRRATRPPAAGGLERPRDRIT
jgi:hypothetical protein